MTFIKEVMSFSNTNINYESVVFFLVVDKTRVLTLTEKRGTVGLLAGNIERFDKTIFRALKREYKEEMGHEMPRLDMSAVRCFNYNNETAIYYGEIDSKDIKFTPNKEIIAAHFTSFRTLREAIDSKTKFKLRQCAKVPMKLLMDKLKLF